MNVAEQVLEKHQYRSYFLDSINSTSQFLREKLIEGAEEKFFCSAIEQTSGYGQRNRSWESNRLSLKFSLGFCYQKDIGRLGVLGLSLALSLRKILSKFHEEELMVKWPNDIYSSKGKVSGILTEIVSSSVSGEKSLLLGIGINVDDCPTSEGFSADAVKSLSMGELLERLLPEIEEIYGNSKNAEFTLFDNWKKYDFFAEGDKVGIIDGKEEYHGIYKGLSDKGFPKVEVRGRVLEYISADVSLKKESS